MWIVFVYIQKNIINNNFYFWTITILFIIMCIIKFLFYFIGRCMVTSLEDNNLFNNSSELFGNTILENPNEKNVEEILINMGNTIIINKIFILSILRFYKITYFE